MSTIKSISKAISVNSTEVEALIEELTEREEYACTLDGCAGKVCGVN